MNFLRFIIMAAGAIALGALQVGFIAAMPFPFSEFPLLAIILACSFVIRARASIFWYAILVAGISDLYSGVGFGASIISVSVITMIGHRVSSEMITHRSLFGSVVIGALTGLLWSVTRLAAVGIFEWWKSIEMTLTFSHIALAITIQTIVTAFVCAALFVLLPHWWLTRSPTTVNSRGI